MRVQKEMSRQGNKYEQTVAFCLVPYEEDSEGQLVQVGEQLFLQEEFVLPISKKKYKATLKNVDVFVEEYLKLHTNIASIRLDRISHVKIYKR